MEVAEVNAPLVVGYIGCCFAIRFHWGATVTRQGRTFTLRIHKCSNCSIFVAICAYSLLHYMHI